MMWHYGKTATSMPFYAMASAARAQGGFPPNLPGFLHPGGHPRPVGPFQHPWIPPWYPSPAGLPMGAGAGADGGLGGAPYGLGGPGGKGFGAVGAPRGGPPTIRPPYAHMIPSMTQPPAFMQGGWPATWGGPGRGLPHLPPWPYPGIAPRSTTTSSLGAGPFVELGLTPPAAAVRPFHNVRGPRPKASYPPGRDSRGVIPIGRLTKPARVAAAPPPPPPPPPPEKVVPAPQTSFLAVGMKLVATADVDAALWPPFFAQSEKGAGGAAGGGATAEPTAASSTTAHTRDHGAMTWRSIVRLHKAQGLLHASTPGAPHDTSSLPALTATRTVVAEAVSIFPDLAVITDGVLLEAIRQVTVADALEVVAQVHPCGRLLRACFRASSSAMPRDPPPAGEPISFDSLYVRSAAAPNTQGIAQSTVPDCKLLREALAVLSEDALPIDKLYRERLQGAPANGHLRNEREAASPLGTPWYADNMARLSPALAAAVEERSPRPAVLATPDLPTFATPAYSIFDQLISLIAGAPREHRQDFATRGVQPHGAQPPKPTSASPSAAATLLSPSPSLPINNPVCQKEGDVGAGALASSRAADSATGSSGADALVAKILFSKFSAGGGGMGNDGPSLVLDGMSESLSHADSGGYRAASAVTVKADAPPAEPPASDRQAFELLYSELNKGVADTADAAARTIDSGLTALLQAAPRSSSPQKPKVDIFDMTKAEVDSLTKAEVASLLERPPQTELSTSANGTSRLVTARVHADSEQTGPATTAPWDTDEMDEAASVWASIARRSARDRKSLWDLLHDPFLKVASLSGGVKARGGAAIAEAKDAMIVRFELETILVQSAILWARSVVDHADRGEQSLMNGFDDEGWGSSGDSEGVNVIGLLSLALRCRAVILRRVRAADAIVTAARLAHITDEVKALDASEAAVIKAVHVRRAAGVGDSDRRAPLVGIAEHGRVVVSPLLSTSLPPVVPIYESRSSALVLAGVSPFFSPSERRRARALRLRPRPSDHVWVPIPPGELDGHPELVAAVARAKLANSTSASRVGAGGSTPSGVARIRLSDDDDATSTSVAPKQAARPSHKKKKKEAAQTVSSRAAVRGDASGAEENSSHPTAERTHDVLEIDSDSETTGRDFWSAKGSGHLDAKIDLNWFPSRRRLPLYKESRVVSGAAWCLWASEVPPACRVQRPQGRPVVEMVSDVDMTDVHAAMASPHAKSYYCAMPDCTDRFFDRVAHLRDHWMRIHASVRTSRGGPTLGFSRTELEAQALRLALFEATTIPDPGDGPESGKAADGRGRGLTRENVSQVGGEVDFSHQHARRPRKTDASAPGAATTVAPLDAASFISAAAGPPPPIGEDGKGLVVVFKKSHKKMKPEELEARRLARLTGEPLPEYGVKQVLVPVSKLETPHLRGVPADAAADSMSGSRSQRGGIPGAGGDRSRIQFLPPGGEGLLLQSSIVDRPALARLAASPPPPTENLVWDAVDFTHITSLTSRAAQSVESYERRQRATYSRSILDRASALRLPPGPGADGAAAAPHLDMTSLIPVAMRPAGWRQSSDSEDDMEADDDVADNVPSAGAGVSGSTDAATPLLKVRIKLLSRACPKCTVNITRASQVECQVCRSKLPQLKSRLLSLGALGGADPAPKVTSDARAKRRSDRVATVPALVEQIDDSPTEESSEGGSAAELVEAAYPHVPAEEAAPVNKRAGAVKDTVDADAGASADLSRSVKRARSSDVTTDDAGIAVEVPNDYTEAFSLVAVAEVAITGVDPEPPRRPALPALRAVPTRSRLTGDLDISSGLVSQTDGADEPASSTMLSSAHTRSSASSAAASSQAAATAAVVAGHAKPWEPGMSKYLGVTRHSAPHATREIWEARLKFRRETAPTMQDAEEYFEIMAKQLNIDPATRIRTGYVPPVEGKRKRDGAPAARGGDAEGGDGVGGGVTFLSDGADDKKRRRL